MKVSRSTVSASKTRNKKWPKSVTVGGAVVKVYRVDPKNAEPYFQIADYTRGKRTLRTITSESKALEEAQRIARKISLGQVGAAEINHRQAASYATAVDHLKPTGDSLELAAARYAEAVKILGGNSACLLEAVRDYARRHPASLESKPVDDVVQELIAIKKSRGASDRYLGDLKSRLGRFADAFRTSVSSVSRADIQSWLDDLPVGPQSYRNYRTVIHTLFEFCLARQYVMDNPVEGIEQPKVRQGDKAIYTPAEMKALLNGAERDMIPFLAIGGFAGLRTNEIERLEWRDVTDSSIIVTAGKAKTGSRRIVPMTENLKAILAPFRDLSGMVWPKSHDDLYNAQQKLAQSVGIKWKANGLRHSYASYRLALVQNEAQVA
jgi:integrase